SASRILLAQFGEYLVRGFTPSLAALDLLRPPSQLGIPGCLCIRVFVLVERMDQEVCQGGTILRRQLGEFGLEFFCRFGHVITSATMLPRFPCGCNRVRPRVPFAPRHTECACYFASGRWSGQRRARLRA